MADETDAQKDKVTAEAESTDKSVSKDEKLSRVKEKLQSMGMMPGDKADVDHASTEQTRKPLLLMISLAIIAIIIGAMAFYASDINNHATTVMNAESNTMPASNHQMMGMHAPEFPDVIWPKPLLADHVKDLQEARKLYWQRDLKKSEQAYTELLEDVKDQPNLYGELGNVQSHAGKVTEAVESYYQAALLLIEQNRQAEVGHAISAVARFDQDKARELMDKLANKHYSQ